MKRFIKGLITYLVAVLVMTAVLVLTENIYFKGLSFFSIKNALITSIVVSLIFLILIKWLISYLSRIGYLHSTIGKIDNMSGEEFEIYLKAFFEKSGYEVLMTPTSNDYGADLICKKKDKVLVVQAKRYEANVGASAVQEIVAAKEYYGADECIVVTNSYFTKNAISLAEANDVTLWDRDFVTKMGRIRLKDVSVDENMQENEEEHDSEYEEKCEDKHEEKYDEESDS